MIEDVKMFKTNHAEQQVAVEWFDCKVLNILWSVISYKRPHKKSGEKAREVPCKRQKIASFPPPPP